MFSYKHFCCCRYTNFTLQLPISCVSCLPVVYVLSILLSSRKYKQIGSYWTYYTDNCNKSNNVQSVVKSNLTIIILVANACHKKNSHEQQDLNHFNKWRLLGRIFIIRFVFNSTKHSSVFRNSIFLNLYKHLRDQRFER